MTYLVRELVRSWRGSFINLGWGIDSAVFPVEPPRTVAFGGVEDALPAPPFQEWVELAEHGWEMVTSFFRPVLRSCGHMVTSFFRSVVRSCRQMGTPFLRLVVRSCRQMMGFFRLVVRSCRQMSFYVSSRFTRCAAGVESAVCSASSKLV